MKVISFLFSLLIVIIIFISSTGSVEAAALGGYYYPGYNSPPAAAQPGTGPAEDPNACLSGTFSFNSVCTNANSVGVTACSGAACTSGSLWSRFTHNTSWYFTYDSISFITLCWPVMTKSTDVCSTADKCVLSDGAYLRAGYCDCTTGSPYKVCCASGGGLAGSCVQISNDGIDPPYEGICPSGSSTDFCGWGGYPACNSSACGPPPPPAPSVTGSSAYCGAGTTASMDVNWSGSGTATYYEISYGPNGWGNSPWQTIPLGTSGVATITGFTPNNTITYNIRACNSGGCSGYDPNGYYTRALPAACPPAGPPTNTPTPTPTSPVPTATPTPVDPFCPNIDIDGHVNSCANSCPPGTAPKGAAANAACTAFNGTSFCCHPVHTPTPTPFGGGTTYYESGYTTAYTTTYTTTYTSYYESTYTWCGDGTCNGGETADWCDDCRVSIRGRIIEDTNRNEIIDAGDQFYSNTGGTTISLSGASSGSYTSVGFGTPGSSVTSANNSNFIFANRTATNDNYSLNFVMPTDYELITAVSSPKPRAINVLGSSDPDLNNTVWLISEINECDDGINNDGDGGTDCGDSACHTDGNPSNPSTCCDTPPCSEDPPGGTECSDSIDNGDPEDALVDGADPGCHTDNDATDGDNTWDPNDDNETDIPDCDTLFASPNPVNAGGQVTLSAEDCINTTPTVTPTTTPPFEHTPTPAQPPGEGRDCSDGTDNDSDSLVDSFDPGCHADGNPNNPSSYDPNDDDETNSGGGGTPQCSDTSDNDGDTLIDINDPGCHTDGNPSNPASYDPNDDNEAGSGGGGANPECSDGSDNDSDSFTDINDPGCHTDGNPSNPASYDPNDDHESSVPYPECSDGQDNADPDSLVDYQDPECHTDGDPTNPDTYNPDDPSESSPANSCSDASISNVSNNASYTTSTATWTAPACPGNGGLTCPVEMTVNGQGGSTDLSFGNITVNPTYNITVQVQEDTNYNDCTSGATPYGGNVQVGLTRNTPVPQQTATRTMSGGSETFSCQLPGTYEISIATPNGYRGVDATLVSGGPQSSGSQVSTNQFNLTMGASNPTVRFCITSLAPWIQTDSGDVRFNIIDNPVPAGQSASSNVANPSLLFSSIGDTSIGLGSLSPDGTKEWIIDDEYSYNRNMKSVNGAAAYTFYKSRIKQRNISLNTFALGGAGAVVPPATGVYEITGDSNGDFDLTGYTHPAAVGGVEARVVLLVPGDLRISSNIDVPTGGLLIVAVQGSITIDESVGDCPAVGAGCLTDYTSTASHLDGIFTAEEDILIPGNLCTDGSTQDRKLTIAGSIVANARKPFADDPVGGGIIDNQRSLCQDDADYASVNVTTRADFLLQLTDFYKTTYSRWKEVRP